MNTGLTAHVEMLVSSSDTAISRGSGSLEVLATPALSELMEACCCACIESELEEGMTSVGHKISVTHSAPTPVGMQVVCDCALESVKGKVLQFSVVASDDMGEIGRAEHERVLVKTDEFQISTNAKLSD